MSAIYATSASVFVIALLFAATLVVARREFELAPHVRIWAASFLFLALSHLCRLAVLDAPASGTAFAYLARMALVASMVLLAGGFRQRIGRLIASTRWTGLAVTALLAMCWWDASTLSLPVGRFLTASTVVAMVVIIFRSLRRTGGTTLIAKGISVLCGSYMVLLAVAAWSVWLDGGVTDRAFAGLTLIGMPVVTVGAGVLVLLVLLSDLAGALRDQALSDPLTRVLNRRGLERRMSGLAKSPDTSLTVIAADLDKFKSINDRLGHAAGDKVLIAFARHLTEAAPEFQVARVGGEEFLLVASGVQAQEAVMRARTICQGVALAALRAHGIAGITSSFGVAFGYCSDTLESLSAKADQALYQAKRDGRDRVAVFSPDAGATQVPA